MRITITGRELLEYHREKHIAHDEKLKQLRQYILANEEFVIDKNKVYIYDIDEIVEQEQSQVEEPIDLGEVEVDSETLQTWTYDEKDPQFQEYLSKQKEHKKKFLEEIKQKGLTLKKVDSNVLDY